MSQRSSTNGMLEQFVISELRKAKIQLGFSFLWGFFHEVPFQQGIALLWVVLKKRSR